jgi:hypothetical protein
VSLEMQENIFKAQRKENKKRKEKEKENKTKK